MILTLLHNLIKIELKIKKNKTLPYRILKSNNKIKNPKYRMI